MNYIWGSRTPSYRPPAGLTFDAAQSAILAWRDGAIKAGWESKPTYQGEDESSAFSMSWQGWKVLATARPAKGQTSPTASFSMWGSDGLAVRVDPMEPFDMAKILERGQTCEFCGKVVEKTVRVAFANRACPACAPAARKRLETPGWAD